MSAEAPGRQARQRNAHESSVLLDEEDALDGDGGVGVDHERRVLEVRNEKRGDREELVFCELRSKGGVSESHAEER